MTREQQIENYMKSLQISRAEAEQLFEDDQADFIGEEGEEMTKKAKEVRRYEQADKPKSKKKREVKLDEMKIEIIKFLENAMDSRHRFIEEDEWDFENVIVKNPQKEITFVINGCEYSLNLVKHRPPKA
jgi:hypothetical protein